MRGIDVDDDGRPIPTGGGLALLFGGIVFCLTFVLFPLVLPGIVRNAECPDATFYSDYIGSPQPLGLADAAVGFGSMGMLCFAIPMLRQSISGGPNRLPAALRIAAIVAASMAVLFGYAFLIDKANDFVCASPKDLSFRQGLRDELHETHWDNVRAMLVSCQMQHTKSKSYPVATVELILQSGLHLPMKFLDRDRFSMLILKKILKDQEYKYYLNGSVTPEFCPGSLYGDISNWPSE